MCSPLSSSSSSRPRTFNTPVGASSRAAQLRKLVHTTGCSMSPISLTPASSFACPGSEDESQPLQDEIREYGDNIEGSIIADIEQSIARLIHARNLLYSQRGRQLTSRRSSLYSEERKPVLVHPKPQRRGSPGGIPLLDQQSSESPKRQCTPFSASLLGQELEGSWLLKRQAPGETEEMLEEYLEKIRRVGESQEQWLNQKGQNGVINLVFRELKEIITFSNDDERALAKGETTALLRGFLAHTEQSNPILAQTPAKLHALALNILEKGGVQLDERLKDVPREVLCLVAHAQRDLYRETLERKTEAMVHIENEETNEPNST